MGGVAASFASLGDLVFAEPKALIGFAGPRTIKATIRIELPKGFQTSEFLLEHGFIDRIVRRADLKSEIARVDRLLRQVISCRRILPPRYVDTKKGIIRLCASSGLRASVVN